VLEAQGRDHRAADEDRDAGAAGGDLGAAQVEARVQGCQGQFPQQGAVGGLAAGHHRRGRRVFGAYLNLLVGNLADDVGGGVAHGGEHVIEPE
jgi:hypothetical protein